MNYKHLLIVIALLPAITLASNTQLIKEKEINNWGYITLSHENSTNNGITINKQFIKSIEEAKGKKNHYHYYLLSRECFSSKISASKRRLTLVFLDEKDYRVSNLEGSCVRIIDTAAYFGTFKEQPRIFTLFNKYLNNENT